MYRILIAEDHETLGYVLKEYLSINGYDVILAINGNEAVRYFKQFQPHLCILDVMLPEMDGFEIAGKIKAIENNIPIIFLTAKALKVDKVKGFKLGADDYIVKPVDEEELILRIKSILKRSYPGFTIQGPEIAIGNFLFDPKKRILAYKEHIQTLTEKENSILYLLAASKGDLVSRKDILNKIWGATDYFTIRTMDVHLSKLRKHLAADQNISIINVHNKGFILREL
jgi:DNA-binding response OmpR family regulator